MLGSHFHCNILSKELVFTSGEYSMFNEIEEFFIQFLAFQLSVYQCIYFASEMSLKRIGEDTTEGKVMCLNISFIALNVRIGSALKTNIHDALSVPYKFVSAGQTINSQLVRNLLVYCCLHDIALVDILQRQFSPVCISKYF
jgi:hypothetical protein